MKYTKEMQNGERNINILEWLYKRKVNYELYGILAGIRREDITPISEPRNVPMDMSEEIEQIYKETMDSSHTFSHLYLYEILEYDWNQYITIKGNVNAYHYFEWKNSANLLPDGMSDSVTGQSITNVDNKEMEKIIKNNEISDEEKKYIYTNLEIPIKTKDAAPIFYYQCIPILKNLGKPENVRIVFWFNS